MVSDWDTYPISDFVTLSQGLAINAKSKYLLEETGLPLLRITDLINGTQVHFVNEEKAPPKCIATDHELIYTRTGQVGLVYRNKVGVVHNNCFKVIPSPELDKDFLYWFLFQESTKAHVNAVASGSVQKDLNHAAFLTLSIPKPELSEQKAIASILDSLDDKIELNRQMNETLEAMAQALFKSWFVDFDPVIDNALAAGNAIPDEFIERAEQRKGIEKKDNSEIQSLFPDEFEFTEEMGWIPKGWEISTLGQESDFSNGYAFKSKELTAESKDAFHVFKMGHIKRGGGFNYDGTKSYFPIEAAKDLERYLLKKGDLLMAMTDMKSSMALLGHTALMPEDDKFLVNQRVGRLSVKEDATLNYPYIYIYSNLDTTIGELRSRANSGVQVNLSTAEIKATNILVPSRSVHDIFNVKAISFFEKTFLNDRLNRKLAETRDTLLPKLMSGEIRISDAEALVENV